jgi:hypothetical protein
MANPDLGFVPELVGPGCAVSFDRDDGLLYLYRASS